MLESDHTPSQYYAWNRWGRVGEERGMQNALKGPMSMPQVTPRWDPTLTPHPDPPPCQGPTSMLT